MYTIYVILAFQFRKSEPLRIEVDPGSVSGTVSSIYSSTGLSGGNSKLEPPDPISNSEVKQLSADGSVGSPHVRVGHRQALNTKPRSAMDGVFLCAVYFHLYAYTSLRDY